eukprot:scaffold257837_cov33-Tisochrysis_lutea.AAC.1
MARLGDFRLARSLNHPLIPAGFCKAGIERKTVRGDEQISKQEQHRAMDARACVQDSSGAFSSILR